MQKKFLSVLALLWSLFWIKFFKKSTLKLTFPWIEDVDYFSLSILLTWGENTKVWSSSLGNPISDHNTSYLRQTAWPRNTNKRSKTCSSASVDTAAGDAINVKIQKWQNRIARTIINKQAVNRTSQKIVDSFKFDANKYLHSVFLHGPNI